MAEIMMSASKHLAGCALLLAALGLLAVLPLLPGTVSKSVQLPIEQNQLDLPDSEVLVVFGGFTGCGETCPVTLRFLGDVYAAVDDRRLGVAFVNILLDTPSAQSMAYAQSFHPAFIGYSIQSDQRGDFYTTLGLAADRDINRLLLHSGNTFVFVRQKSSWQLTRVYPSLPTRQAMAEDIAVLLRQATRSRSRV